MLNKKVYLTCGDESLDCERDIAKRVLEELSLTGELSKCFIRKEEDLTTESRTEIKNCETFILLLSNNLSSIVEKEFKCALDNKKTIIVFIKVRKAIELKERLTLLQRVLSDSDDVVNKEDIFHEKPFQIRSFGCISELESEITRALGDKITTVTTTTKEQMYRLGINIMRNAQKRLYVIQRTPTLFLGARPYNAPEDKKYLYELDIYSTLKDWINKAVEDTETEFMYLFSLKDTKDEIEEILGDIKDETVKAERKERIKENIVKFKDIEVGDKVVINPLLSDYSGPIIVGDEQFAIGITGESDAICISFINKRFSDELVNIFKRLRSKRRTANEIFEVLGL